MKFNYAQAYALTVVFGGDEETIVTVSEGEGHSGPGLYAIVEGAEDEGAVFLGCYEEPCTCHSCGCDFSGKSGDDICGKCFENFHRSQAREHEHKEEMRRDVFGE